MSNSIAVPLGYVDWHFEGQAVRKVDKNEWSLKKGMPVRMIPHDRFGPHAHIHRGIILSRISD